MPRESSSRNIRPIGTFAIANSCPFGIATFAAVSGRLVTTLHLPLDRNIGVPIFRQISRRTAPRHSGRPAAPGQRIPSTRGLAADLGVSRLPVLSAYEQLLHEGYLVGRTGSGTFVSEHSVPDELLRSPAVAAEPPVPPRNGTAVRETRGAPLSRRLRELEPPDRSVPGRPPRAGSLPARGVGEVVVRQLHAETPDQTGVHRPCGAARTFALSIAEHIRSRARFDAWPIRCSSCPGLRRRCGSPPLTLLEPSDRVAIEEPGYFGAHRALAGRRSAARAGAR